MYATEVVPFRPTTIDAPVQYGDYDFAWMIAAQVFIAALSAGATVSQAAMASRRAAAERRAEAKLSQEATERARLALDQERAKAETEKAKAKAGVLDLGKTVGQLPWWGTVVAGTVAGLALRYVVKSLAAPAPTQRRRRR